MSTQAERDERVARMDAEGVRFRHPKTGRLFRVTKLPPLPDGIIVLETDDADSLVVKVSVARWEQEFVAEFQK